MDFYFDQCIFIFFMPEADRQTSGLPDGKGSPLYMDICNNRVVTNVLPTSKESISYAVIPVHRLHKILL